MKERYNTSKVFKQRKQLIWKQPNQLLSLFENLIFSHWLKILVKVSIWRLGENPMKHSVMDQIWYFCLLVPSINYTHALANRGHWALFWSLVQLILKFSSTRLIQTSWFRMKKLELVRRLHLHFKLLI